MNTSSITYLIIYIGIILIVFLVLREVVLWYFKINQTIRNQEITNSLLESILKEIKKDSLTHGADQTNILDQYRRKHDL